MYANASGIKASHRFGYTLILYEFIFVQHKFSTQAAVKNLKNVMISATNSMNLGYID